MTDDKTPEPIVGQYTFFPAQEVLEHMSGQKAQEPIREITLEEILQQAHERRIKMLNETPGEKETPDITESMNFSIAKVDEILESKTYREAYREFMEKHPGTSVEYFINDQERRLIPMMFFFVDIMRDYIKEHPGETLDSLWDNRNQDSEAWQDLHALAAQWEPIRDRLWAELDGEPSEPQKQPRDKRSKAVEKGALMTIGGRLASYSAKGFENALNTPSIFKLPEERKDIAAIFNEHGQLNIVAMQGSKLKPLTELHTAFLMALNQIATIAAHNGLSSDTSGLMTVYLPQFCREIGLDPRKYSKLREGAESLPLDKLRFAAVLELLRPLEAYVGRTPDGAYWRLAAFHSYDPESDTLTFSAPYLYELRKAEALQQGKALNQLLHGSVVNESNRAAVELANRILDGLLQRGTRPDYATYRNKPPVKKETVKTTKADGSKETRITVYENQEQAAPAPAEPIVTYQVKFKNLIRDCPQFRRELEDILAGKQIDPRTGQESKSKPAAAYNMKLKHTFEAAIKIILTKSDAPAYFVDLDINPKHPKTGGFAAPTKSALAHDLTITHKGKNPAFRPQEQ